MEKNDEKTIQNIVPGPPEQTAVATPTMFPVPRQAPKTEQTAENGDISPLIFFLKKDEKKVFPISKGCLN
jgi:hypothetical protein